MLSLGSVTTSVFSAMLRHTLLPPPLVERVARVIDVKRVLVLDISVFCDH